MVVLVVFDGVFWWLELVLLRGWDVVEVFLRFKLFFFWCREEGRCCC